MTDLLSKGSGTFLAFHPLLKYSSFHPLVIAPDRSATRIAAPDPPNIRADFPTHDGSASPVATETAWAGFPALHALALAIAQRAAVQPARLYGGAGARGVRTDPGGSGTEATLNRAGSADPADGSGTTRARGQ